MEGKYYVRLLFNFCLTMKGNVTITVDKWYKKPDIIEQTIQALFKDPEKVKDRPVFITIM